MTSERLLMLAAVIDVESGFLEECVRYGAVSLEEIPEGREEFTPAQLARLRRLQRICRSLEVDVYSGCIIVDLLERLDALERELQQRRAAAQDDTADL
jgi:chaperone modulatory protein CbpM